MRKWIFLNILSDFHNFRNFGGLFSTNIVVLKGIHQNEENY